QSGEVAHGTSLSWQCSSGWGGSLPRLDVLHEDAGRAACRSGPRSSGQVEDHFALDRAELQLLFDWLPALLDVHPPLDGLLRRSGRPPLLKVERAVAVEVELARVAVQRLPSLRPPEDLLPHLGQGEPAPPPPDGRSALVDNVGVVNPVDIHTAMAE